MTEYKDFSSYYSPPQSHEEADSSFVEHGEDSHSVLDKYPRIATTRRGFVVGGAVAAATVLIGKELGGEKAQGTVPANEVDSRSNIQEESQREKSNFNSGEIEIIGAPAPPFEDEN